ncbi:hypothetical protein [Halobacillus sp. BBL2006]|uniref:hypothetical protein n=1 Tax=Halobacillus sp. BBL2006 TaxID=1543706 RepID=UPI000543654D|nr:hypothetical protein [Halobacillus sp. BBL2006]KHE72776.1 hypothetical protein LD39_02855 [Halobacillus sp. BBL2006]
MDIRELLDEKKAVFELENDIQRNTQEVFDLIKDLTSQLCSGQQDAILNLEGNTIAVAAYNSMLGVTKIEDVSILRDPDLISESGVEALKETTNWKKVALQEGRNEYITGLIVFQSKHESLGIEQEIGRLYVNKDKRITFKGLVGGKRIEVMEANEIDSRLPEILQSTLEDAFFEGCTYWE